MNNVLYWNYEYNSEYPKLLREFLFLLRKNKLLSDRYESLSNDDVEQLNQFLRDFFPENIPMTYYVSNLSVSKDKENRIKLAFRAPKHPVFNGLIPEHSALLIKGFWNTQYSNQRFIPEEVFLTHADELAADYEVELEISPSALRPPRENHNNILTQELAKNLPPISSTTERNLKNWSAFLSFKRELVQEKTRGLRYLECQFTPTNDLAFVVITDGEEELQQTIKVFSRKDLESFDLTVSENEWQFRMNSKLLEKKFPKGFELGQLKSRKAEIITLPNRRSPSEIRNPIYSKVTIELTEDLKNKISNIDDSDELKVIQSELLAKIPNQGFISFPSIGDLALIKRHERAITNLIQNEGCYSPYLSSYLFDISKAGKVTNATKVNHWFNDNLNEHQKNAVIKMMSAPDLCLVQGPPGTGKTTVIAETILQLVNSGQKVLLASQAHDAIDNALGRIKNHPELKAIRLARDSSKITEEGKSFSDDQALGRYYDALKTHAQSVIDPIERKQKEMSSIKKWIDTAEYVIADQNRNTNQIKEIKLQISSKNSEVNKANAIFNEEESIYQSNLQKIDNLEQVKRLLSAPAETELLSFSNIVLTPKLSDLLNELFNLKTIKIKLKFDESDMRNATEQNKFIILQSLLNSWANVVTHKEIIQNDLFRLKQQGISAISNQETTKKIQLLENREHELNNLMEDSDDPAISQEWRDVRKQLKDLKSESHGLNLVTYKLFEDSNIFTTINDVEMVIELLSQRLTTFEQIDLSVKEKIEVFLKEINQFIHIASENISQPIRKEVEQLEREIISLRDKEKSLLIAQTKLDQEARTKLKEHNLPEDTVLSTQINNIKEYVLREEKRIEQMNKEQSGLINLMKDWIGNLSQKQVSEYDWTQVGQTFKENSNLYAISCNEDEQTLIKAGADSFDVAIIDEVSKATPIEILLPLMKARRAILVGDHRQLPPIFQESQDAQTFADKAEEEQEDNTGSLLTKENVHRFEKMVTASLFKEHFEASDPSIRERLTVQFRMHPDIMKIVNKFYDGQLECGNPDKDRSHGVVLNGKNNELVSSKDHVLWIDTSKDLNNQITRENENNTNRLEADLIADTLMKINAQMRNQGFGNGKKQKVGVVSFYASQCRVIREAIKKINNNQLRFYAIDVEINTVIRYQGKEKPIILISLVRNDGRPKDQRRSSKANVARFEFINVAMSRAQNLLIVFGARNMLELREVVLPKMDEKGTEKRQVYREIFSDLDRNARIFHASEMQITPVTKNK